jgi:hypothetical protein
MYLIVLVCCIEVAILVIKCNLVKSKNVANALVLSNIEALANNESGHDEFYPCTSAGGVCIKSGKIYHGISMD